MAELMLVDAASLYFRAFYAVPESVTAPDGRPVNAVRGYLAMLASLIDRRDSTMSRAPSIAASSWRSLGPEGRDGVGSLSRVLFSGISRTWCNARSLSRIEAIR